MCPWSKARQRATRAIGCRRTHVLPRAASWAWLAVAVAPLPCPAFAQSASLRRQLVHPLPPADYLGLCLRTQNLQLGLRLSTLTTQMVKNGAKIAWVAFGDDWILRSIETNPLTEREKTVSYLFARQAGAMPGPSCPGETGEVVLAGLAIDGQDYSGLRMDSIFFNSIQNLIGIDARPAPSPDHDTAPPPSERPTNTNQGDTP